jgi:hypothetical protein
MELIRNVIEWIGSELGSTLATLFPFMLIGLLGLYVLWLVIGYLRVSQIGLGEGRAVQQAMPLPAGPTGVERPRGVPYCSFDGLAFPIGARFCTSCERDLFLECSTCAATVSAADASCYRCGTPTGAAADVALLG